MKNSNNKLIAGIVCGLIVGSIGTSFIGNFQNNSNIASSGNFSHDSQFNSSDGQNQQVQQGQYGPPGQNGGKQGHHHGPVQQDQSSENVADDTNAQYTDGTYDGVATGYGGNINVEVKVSSGKIANIDIKGHSETPGFYEKAFNQVPSEIIKKQSTKVDSVSGATYSSNGIMNAVRNALKNAKVSQQ